PEKAARLFSNLLLSEKTWIERIQGRRSTQMNIWQPLSQHTWAIILHENEKNYLDYISGISDDDLQPKISYTSSKGIEYQTPLADILTHVSMHNVGHRGQIAIALSQAGLEPVNTDFISFARL
ncbi:MAG: DinB family protein, partial [Calditrichia bacterium]